MNQLVLETVATDLLSPQEKDSVDLERTTAMKLSRFLDNIRTKPQALDHLWDAFESWDSDHGRAILEKLQASSQTVAARLHVELY